MNSSTIPWDETKARAYVEQWGDHPCNHKTVEMAALKPDDHVLDIGCGSGTAVREAAKLLTAGSITGVDPSPSMIRIAEEQTVGTSNAQRIRYLVGSAAAVPLPDDSATVVIAVNSIHHWPDLAAGLAEVRRLLIPGGKLVLGDEIFEEFEYGDVAESGTSGPQAIETAVRESGFEILRVSEHPVADVRMTVLQARYTKH